MELNQIRILCYAISGVFSLIAFIILFLHLFRVQEIKKYLKEGSKNLERGQTRRQLEYAQNIYNNVENKRGIFYRLDTRFEYSRIQGKWKFMSSSLYGIVMILTTFAVGIIVSAITSNVIQTISSIGITALAFYGYLHFHSRKNFIAVERDMTEFLNELKVYSSTTDDIITCFYSISENMHHPLKEVLVEFCSQAQTSGDKSKAFYDAMNKIEHPMFKQTIRNLEICTRHSADYGVIADNSGKTLRNYLRLKREMAAENKAECFTMSALGLSSFATAYAMGVLTGLDIVDQLLHTSLGNFLLMFQGVFIIAFIWNLLFSTSK